MKQTTDTERRMDTLTVIVGDFNNSLSRIDTTAGRRSRRI